MRRLGVGAEASWGERAGAWARLEHGLFVSDLEAPVWEGVERVGAAAAAGGTYDYTYQRTTFAAAAPAPVPGLSGPGRRVELRLRAGWIGRNVSPEEELFAGELHPVDRFRPLRSVVRLSGYDAFSVRGETLAMAGVAWTHELPAAWRGRLGGGAVAVAGGRAELFANVGNAWGYTASWQRTRAGAPVTDLDGLPVAVPGTRRRSDPFEDPGTAGPRLLTEAGLEGRLDLRLLGALWGASVRLAYGFQGVRGRGDVDGDGVLVRRDPTDPFGAEGSASGLRVAVALGTGLP